MLQTQAHLAKGVCEYGYVNFREKPELAFRNNFRDSEICGNSGMCMHAQPGTVQMTLDV